jgi:ubiquinol oxidase
MESRGGNTYFVDRFVAKHLVLIYYWSNVVYYWMAPRLAYHLSYEVEIHAATTYAKYLADHGHDDKILEILNDELEHSRELEQAMEKIK